jgi:hypothetical protein
MPLAYKREAENQVCARDNVESGDSTFLFFEGTVRWMRIS